MRKQDPKEFIGKKFGKLYILKDLGYPTKGMRRVLAICDCGIEKDFILAHLKGGGIVSCGCHRNKNTALRNYRHGLKRHPLYGKWCTMKERCSRPENSSYHSYGAKGITVCEEWKNSFQSFYDWAIVNGWEKGLTIDRKNSLGNYEPENCRFITQKEQNRNTSANRIINYNGRKLCLGEWGEIFGICPSVVSSRIRCGWTLERAFNQPVKHRNANTTTSTIK